MTEPHSYDVERDLDEEGRDTMDMLREDGIAQAIAAFHTALDRHVSDDVHGREGDWVNGSGEEIVEALLLNGWQPPDTKGDEV